MAVAMNGNILLTIGAVVSGGIFGDHCSPISDTTIMASAGAQCDHVNHVSTQLPYAVTAAAVSCVSYVAAGVFAAAGLPTMLALPIGIALMLLVLLPVFAALWLLSKYVSLGSIFAGVSLTVSVFLFYGHNLLYTALAFVISVLVVWCHRENINRLLHGTERKFQWHSGPPKE